MDASHFDRLARSLSASGSRRGTLAALLGGTLGLLGVAETTARKGKRNGKGKKKKKNDGGQTGTQPPPQPPPPPPGSPADPAPVCSDETKRCGGDCPRCGIAGGCGTGNDCASAFCLLGQCRACAAKKDCGSDANGECYCAQPAGGGFKVCTGQVISPTVQSCAACPPGTVCLNDPVPGNFNCFKFCGVA
jgi:hypothetical protein